MRWLLSVDIGPARAGGFSRALPSLRPVDRQALLDDASVDIICCAAIPRDRADVAIAAMRRGKDVMVDKPGVTTRSQLEAVMACVAETGRIFSVCFSERFVVRASETATRLVAEGAIGKVVHTVGLGPHRLNRAIRPAWFFDSESSGSILVDIASHQIDQFLFYTGLKDAEVIASCVANHTVLDHSEFARFRRGPAPRWRRVGLHPG
jgi:predicted dehydrogenase